MFPMLPAKTSFSDKSSVSITHKQNMFAAKHRDGIAHKQTVVFRQFFAGHVVGSREIKKNRNTMILSGIK